LQKNRQLRYQHASEIRTDLQQLKVITKSAPTTPLQAAGSRSSAWRVAVPAAVIMLALLGAITFRLAHKTAPATKLNEKDIIVLADFANSSKV
jgi:anti-sigma-K factor RskA